MIDNVQDNPPMHDSDSACGLAYKALLLDVLTLHRFDASRTALLAAVISASYLPPISKLSFTAWMCNALRFNPNLCLLVRLLRPK